MEHFDQARRIDLTKEPVSASVKSKSSSVQETDSRTILKCSTLLARAHWEIIAMTNSEDDTKFVEHYLAR